MKKLIKSYINTLTGKNHVHSNADIHAYRAEYATRLYKQVARDINDLKGRKINYTAITGKRNKDGSDIYKNAVYYCRGDQKGTALDRAAMIAASQSLGHNRESVVGEHYIHGRAELDAAGFIRAEENDKRTHIKKIRRKFYFL